MQNSKIEWTHHTFNPWLGCQKVSAGCQHCYAETLMDHRYHKVQWGPTSQRQRTSPAMWRKPFQWDKEARVAGIRYRVFCASLADVFEDRPDLAAWRNDLLHLIGHTRNLDWLLLTKRPENVNRMIIKATGRDESAWLADCRHVWIGTSVEDQAAADERIPELLKVPARIRFLSCEPLLGRVDLTLVTNVEGFEVVTDTLSGNMSIDGQINAPTGSIHWVIAGGESGSQARPMHPDWARDLRNQCQGANVPFFFKQWGEWLPIGQDEDHVIGLGQNDGKFSDRKLWVNQGPHNDAVKVGKANAGRKLDGVEWNQFPSDS